MDGQWVAELSAFHQGPKGSFYARTFHYILPPQFKEFAIIQISLTELQAFTETSPVGCSAFFTDYKTTDDRYTDVGDKPVIIADKVAEFFGYLKVENCKATAIINVFTWPSIA